MKYENEFRVFFPAKGENEALARVMTAAFVSQYDPTVADITDVKTAVSEAVTNAIIHGYAEKKGEVELFCGYCGGRIYIEVADQGMGISDIDQAREPLYTSKPEQERSGLGFVIMESFMEGLQVKSSPGMGTRIYMEKTLNRE